MTESKTNKLKDKNLGVYIGLCAIAWIIGAVVANSVSVMMGAIYSEATLTVIIGFWAGKAILKNKTRNWASIVAFPIIIFISASLGFSLAESLAPQSVGAKGLICFSIAFILSCGLFASIPSEKIKSNK